MSRALIFMIGAGAAIGGLWPGPHEEQPLRIVADAAPTATVEQPKGFATLIDRAEDGHFYVEAQVNNQPVRFMIDTGASGIALTSADARRIGIAFDPVEFRVVGTGASGPVLGKQVILDSVQIEGKTVTALPAVVLGEGLGVSLLGQSFLSRYAHVGIADDRMELR